MSIRPVFSVASVVIHVVIDVENSKIGDQLKNPTFKLLESQLFSFILHNMFFWLISHQWKSPWKNWPNVFMPVESFFSKPSRRWIEIFVKHVQSFSEWCLAWEKNMQARSKVCFGNVSTFVDLWIWLEYFFSNLSNTFKLRGHSQFFFLAVSTSLHSSLLQSSLECHSKPATYCQNGWLSLVSPTIYHDPCVNIPTVFHPPKKSFTTNSFFYINAVGPIVTKPSRVPPGNVSNSGWCWLSSLKGMRKWTRRRTFHREGWTPKFNREWKPLKNSGNVADDPASYWGETVTFQGQTVKLWGGGIKLNSTLEGEGGRFLFWNLWNACVVFWEETWKSKVWNTYRLGI